MRIHSLYFSSNLATFNPMNKGRRLHRHPAFFGTMDAGCLEDFCEVIGTPFYYLPGVGSLIELLETD